MTEIQAKGEITGAGGVNFKAISSFPKTVVACETLVDKINGLREIKYVNHHTDKNGNTTVKEKKVKRKVF